MGRTEQTWPDDLEDARIYIGESIRHYRIDKGLRQGKFAKQIGMHPYTLSRIEKGTTWSSIYIYYIICRGLDISISDILPEEWLDIDMR